MTIHEAVQAEIVTAARQHDRRIRRAATAARYLAAHDKKAIVARIVWPPMSDAQISDYMQRAGLHVSSSPLGPLGELRIPVPAFGWADAYVRSASKVGCRSGRWFCEIGPGYIGHGQSLKAAIAAVSAEWEWVTVSARGCVHQQQIVEASYGGFVAGKELCLEVARRGRAMTIAEVIARRSEPAPA